MNKVFCSEHLIRFSHCDPGGIVYFPHFFDLIHATIEDWFDQAIEPPLESTLLHKRQALPTVNTQCEFFSPCRIGERLVMELSVTHLGRSSVAFGIRGIVAGHERLRGRHVIAMISLERYRAVPIPDDLRAKMAPFRVGGAEQPAPRVGAVPAASEVFLAEHLVRFSHCDPAGIVYFPRFLDMINATVEDWLAEAFGLPFDTLHLKRRLGLPVVNTQCEFYKPCRIGERLVMELSVARLGRSSLVLCVSGKVNGEERLRASNIRALMSLETYKAVAIPDDMRAVILRYAA